MYATVAYQIKICLFSTAYFKGFQVLIAAGYRSAQLPPLSRKHAGQRLAALAGRGRGFPVPALPLTSPGTVDTLLPF